jgi:hypothetical protein
VITPIKISNDVTFLKRLNWKKLLKIIGKKAKKARNKPPINDIRITICSRYFVVSFP